MDNKDKAIKKAMKKETAATAGKMRRDKAEADLTKAKAERERAKARAMKKESKGIGGVVGIPALGDFVRGK